MHCIARWFIIDPLNEVEGGGVGGGVYTGFTLSVCPSVDKIVSALYLQQYSPDLFTHLIKQLQKACRVYRLF